MRAVGRHRFQRLRHHLLNLPIRNLARCADTRLIQQFVQAKLSKPLPPLGERCTCDMQLPRDPAVLIPSPQWSTIRARNAMACAEFGRGMRSRLEPMQKVARMLRAHEELILNWFRAKGEISSGAVEGLNNKIRVVTRRSYGFRTYEAMEIALYHKLGRLPEPESTHISAEEAESQGSVHQRRGADDQGLRPGHRTVCERSSDPPGNLRKRAAQGPDRRRTTREIRAA